MAVPCLLWNGCPCLLLWNGKHLKEWERGGSVVERRTQEREVGGSKPTSAVLCP